MRKLLNKVRVRCTARSPKLDLGKSCLRCTFPLFILPLDSLHNRVSPWFHSCGIVVHQFLVLDITLDVVSNSHNGQFNRNCSWDLDWSVTNMGDELLEIFPSLSIFALKRKENVFKKETEDIQLILHRASHQVTDAMPIHLVTYLNQIRLKSWEWIYSNHKLILS